MKQNYRPSLTIYETQNAIGFIKEFFPQQLASRLHLIRVTAPLFVDPATGLNDDLCGVERPVSFDIPAIGRTAQVVHSLAKWKRQALGKYGFSAGTGLYTDMNAIRRDEQPDELHSVYVDQWDWEAVITRQQRTRTYLEETVRQIVSAICATGAAVKELYPQLTQSVCPEVSFLTGKELASLYPDLTPRERENAYLRTHPTTFLLGIGGGVHDSRAPDYDDWTLNGDLLLWSDVLEQAVELSSMGIRVDGARMTLQCTQAGCASRLSLPFHRDVLRGRLPLSIGGGIGQSRLCMLLLDKAHIGEVQVSLWPEETHISCRRQGIPLL